VCVAEIQSLHPTQFAVGMIEVRSKEQDLSSMSDKKLQKYMRKHTVPAVIGPNGVLYMTDHHHYARALLDIGIDQLYVQVTHDFSALGTAAFWQEMRNDKLDYLIDENGKGPNDPMQLPADVASLHDDVFRSLAWAVQSQTNAYAESDVPYASFMWAEFFRAGIDLSLARDHFDSAVQRGAELAKSPAAKDLPGYTGP
jgi:hypothetical protein